MRPAAVIAMLLCLVLDGCAAHRPAARLDRRGDEIVICGQLYHTGAPVILWTDPGGYDAYRTDFRFTPRDQSEWKPGGPVKSPARYNQRTAGLNPDEIERTRGGGWDLPTLQRTIDQFIIHYDAAGTSRTCFRVLHDQRGLSVHFMLDLDGTIYQTLDVKERAWHATISNDRSVGIEIANPGAYPPGSSSPLSRWYRADAAGRTALTIPADLAGGGVRHPTGLRPARDGAVRGTIQGQTLEQYDLTPQQYESLEHLTAALCTVLPRIRCDAPRGPDGHVTTETLPPDRLASYAGLLGHYHVQTNKIDPGPAFNWERLIAGARRLMGSADPRPLSGQE